MNNIIDSTLVINLNEEYKIKIENGKKFKASIFKEVYEAALKNVEEIVKQSLKNNVYDDFNNIIAFTGERGKGKSSSMISFRDALEGKNNKKHEDFFSESNILLGKQFATIDIVDPSLFRGEESLFEIILAQMFQKFQKEIRKPDSKLNDDARRAIIKQFQEVFENLQIINSDRKDLYKKESIEALSKLATSSNLRNCFKNLVEIYLNEFENGKDFLIIAIDDFDLNISGAYDMLEDIRQFLIQPKIILFVACKLEQLKETIKIRLCENKLKNEIDKSEKYLEKLIPFTRRILLPDVKKIKKIDFLLKKDNVVLFESKSSNLFEVVKANLYNKFRLIIDNDDVENIFNLETIRGIQNFFNLFNEDITYTIFSNYLLNEIEKSDLDFNFFKNLDNVKIEHLNLSIIKYLSDKFKVSEIRTLAASKIPNRISVGDVIFAIKCIEDRLIFNDYAVFKFITTLKVFYFIKIKELESVNNDICRDFGKYGFVNQELKILGESEKGQSRDFVAYGGKEEQIRKLEIDKLDDVNKFILAQFMYLLGDNKNYRNEYEKEILSENFKKLILSPFGLLHNLYNTQILLNIFNIDEKDSFVKDNLDWFSQSMFIQQMFNPSFTTNYFDRWMNYKKLYIKEELPDNYFDTLILLFVYGSIYSINNKDLVADFIKYPIIKVLLSSFVYRNKKSYSIVNKLNSEYGIENKNDEKLVSNQLITIINTIFKESGNDKEKLSIEEQIKEKLKTLLKRIKARPTYKIQTLSTIINEIREIDEFNREVDQLSSYKDGINSLDDNLVKETKVELLKYLNGRVNG